MSRKILLLGASGGIGGAIAEEFLRNGESVMAPGLDELDLQSGDSIKKYADSLGGTAVDVVVHSAGYNRPIPFKHAPEDELTRTMEINVLGFRLLVRLMMDNLVKAGQGHILAVSSIYGSIARDRRSSYVMSKHALNGLIKTLAIELGRHNILVNAISPGFVDTAMTRSNNTVERIRQFENLIPLGRMAAPPEIARVAWFLCSRHNTYITGQDIVVDGGFMAGGFQPS